MSLVAALLLGCHHHEPDYAQVHVIDAVPNVEYIEIGIPGRRDRIRVGSRSGLPYTQFPAGSYRVDLDAGLADEEKYFLPPQPITLAPHHRYAIVAMGSVDADPTASLHVYEETTSAHPLKSSQTLVRAVNACLDAGSIDVLFDNLATFKNLRYGQMSGAIALPAARYACMAKTAGERYTPLDLPRTLQLSGGKVYLVVVGGRVRDETVSIDTYGD